MKSPRLSIIMGLYNCLPLTRECLRSLEATLQGWDYEVILIDDGSTDGTREWLQTLQQPYRIHLNTQNQGFARNNNLGAEMARGDYLVLLNNDLILSPRWFEPMWKLLHKNRRVGLVGNVHLPVEDNQIDHCGVGFDHKGKPYHKNRPTWLGRLRGFEIHPAVTGACLLIRRETFLRLGGFDDRFRNGGEDVDLCLGLRLKGLRALVSLRSVIHHHVSASPGRHSHHESNCRLLFQKWPSMIPALASKSWARHYLLQIRRVPQPLALTDPLFFLQNLFCYLGLWPAPPSVVAGIRNNMQIEESRWEKILGPN